MQFLLRFIIGGFCVSGFAVFADMIRPKSFAGIFAAAPSIALATLGLTAVSDGVLYAAAEGRSMMMGAAGFVVYAVCACLVLFKYKPSAALATLALIPVWCFISGALWLVLNR